jgi:hypothetical protein
MYTFPCIEARVSAQERRQLILDARVEELSEDVTASYKHLSEYLGRIEEDLAKLATKDELAKLATKVEDRFSKIEATMATKEDLASLENRMLDAFKQLLTVIDTRLPAPQG